MKNFDLDRINNELKDKHPSEIVKWALGLDGKSLVTTNFRPYEVAILHLITAIKPTIQVVCCDTGYNTPKTYKHMDYVIDKLDLNIETFVPLRTVAHRNVVMGIPQVDDPKHAEFTEEVKIEPFKRAMAKYSPELWFTNLRQGQTAFRNSIGIVSKSSDGVIKVSPFYYWSDEQLDAYLKENNLDNEFNYFDPTKALENRECGLHN